MNLWFGKAVFIIGFFGIGHIRDPHIRKNKSVKVVDDRKSKFDIGLIVLVTIGGVLLPALWMIFDIFSFADYPLHSEVFAAGLVVYGFAFYLFKKSHDDLGTNWSVSLELRENHQLIDGGVYRAIRHPMYSSLLLYSAGQAFFLPNLIIGPAGVITLAILYLCRVKSEEKMMLDQFGDQYLSYMKRTNRLVPRIF